jgi:hypothetical protein
MPMRSTKKKQTGRGASTAKRRSTAAKRPMKRKTELPVREAAEEEPAIRPGREQGDEIEQEPQTLR